MSHLRETLSAADAFLFKEEAMTPIFCKPKLLPLKTVTTQKLDEMQKEARNRAKAEE
ncbi:BBSome interacting protein 1, partial [Trichostrongylus colubriformis]